MTRYLHIPLWYGYTACDGLARFLERMAMRGWRFREFRLGLEFERCEPTSERYDVQVFLKNREDDSAPSPDTEEFADYCHAAGWEFIDSRRRFVVFRRLREDAVPIVTPRERIDTVFRAELRYRLERLAVMAMLALSNTCPSVKRPEMWLFENILLFLTAFTLIGTAVCLLRLPSLLLWKSRKQRELDNTGEVRCESTAVSAVWFALRLITVTVLLLWMLARYYSQPVVWAAAICTVGLLFVIGWMRLDRGENRAMKTFGVLALYLIVAFVLLTTIFGGEAPVSRDSLTGAALRLSDIEEIRGEEQYCSYERGDSVVGTCERLNAVYGEGRDEQFIELTVYRSRYPKLIEAVYKNVFDRQTFDAKDVNEDWSAVTAVRRVTVPTRYTYFVRYENVCFRLTVREPLTDAQIAIIRERLGA